VQGGVCECLLFCRAPAAPQCGAAGSMLQHCIAALHRTAAPHNTTAPHLHHCSTPQHCTALQRPAAPHCTTPQHPTAAPRCTAAHCSSTAAHCPACLGGSGGCARLTEQHSAPEQRSSFLFARGFCTAATSCICKAGCALRVVHFITFLLLLFYSHRQSGRERGNFLQPVQYLGLVRAGDISC